MTTIRRHTRDDIETLIALAERLAESHRALDPRRFNWTADLPGAYRDWFERALTDPKRGVFVADQGGAPVGYAMCELLDEDTAMWSPAHTFIHDLFVAPEARRTGAARALVEAVAEWARAEGRPQIRAITALDNTAAADFFTGAGFRAAVVERVLER